MTSKWHTKFQHDLLATLRNEGSAGKCHAKWLNVVVSAPESPLPQQYGGIGRGKQNPYSPNYAIRRIREK